MAFNRNIVFALGAWLLASATPLFATTSALVVIGTTGSSSITADLDDAARNIQAGLIARGLAPDAIEVLGLDPQAGKITRQVVLDSLQKRKSLAAADEFWLVLLGFSGRTADDAPAFQVTGPRLTAADLKSALDAIPAQQFVFIGTSDSGSFIPVLMSPNRSVLAATREEGEIDLPRFPEAWAETLKDQPASSWKALAAQAAVLTDKLYADGSLAVGEHARLGDPETGKILEAPFGTDATSTPAEKSQSDGSMALLNASDIKVRDPNA
jgi:hypothetical protein